MMRTTLIAALLALCATVCWSTTISGIVFDDANGNGIQDAKESAIADVRVSDGQTIKVTGKNGKFSFGDKQGFVIIYLTIPANWWPTANKWWVSDQAETLGKVAFGLRHKDETAQPYFVQVSDIHITPAAAPKVVEFCGQVNRMQPQPAFVVATGDLVVDTTSSATEQQAIDLFNLYKQSMSSLLPPLFNLPGNHDHPGVSVPAQWQGSAYFAKGAFPRLMGPLYYSFDYGAYHFVALDNTMPNSPPPDCHSEIGPDCLAWVQKDLQLTPKNRPLVLFMHQPMAEVVGREQLEQLLAGRRVVGAFAGHTHAVKYSAFGPHEVFECGALSGDWWTGPNIDGSPQGYSVIGMTGNGFELFYNSAFVTHYMTPPELVAGSKPGEYSLRARVFDPGDELDHGTVAFDDWTTPVSLQKLFGPVKEITVPVPAEKLGWGWRKAWVEAGGKTQSFASSSDLSINATGSAPDRFGAVTGDQGRWGWGKLMLHSTESEGIMTPDQLLDYYSILQNLDFISVIDASDEWARSKAGEGECVVIPANQYREPDGIRIIWKGIAPQEVMPVHGWYGRPEAFGEGLGRESLSYTPRTLVAVDPQNPEAYLQLLSVTPDPGQPLAGVFAVPGSSIKAASASGPWTVIYRKPSPDVTNERVGVLKALAEGGSFATTDRNLQPYFAALPPADAASAQAPPRLAVGFTDDGGDPMRLTRIYQDGKAVLTAYHKTATGAYIWQPPDQGNTHRWVVEMIQNDGGHVISSPIYWQRR